MAEADKKLLIVEDDEGLRSQLRWAFEQYELLFAEDRVSAIKEIRRHEPDVVLQDLGLPPDPEGVTEGMACVSDILEVAPHTKVIVVTGHGDQDNAVKAVGLGAWDFYEKPVDTEILGLIVRRAFHIHHLEAENRRLARAEQASPLQGLIAASDSMLKVCRLIEKVAPTTATTLLLGESGTGKEVLARALHELSPRKDENFVAINCAAIPENLLESELFGYEKGAFTGAAKQTPGKVESADKGTLFLDEIGDMPAALQAKLLRFLQERVVERVGGRKEIPVDVRVICATNQDLQALTKTSEFREDLYYRVSEVTVNIPPLRERDIDKVVIARAVLEKAAKRHGKGVTGFEPSAVEAIDAYDWPGNVREMENRINSAVIMSESKKITAEDLGFVDDDVDLSLNLRQIRQDAEYKAVNRALTISDGNISRAAELLGITRPTLYDLVNRFNIKVPG